ncbi:ATP-binding protein [Thermodesulfobacteriota bacterium]
MGNSVLVAHTSEKVLSFFKGIFEKEGHDVLFENNGISALKTILKEEPKIALIGTNLPGLNYADVIDTINVNGRKVLTGLICNGSTEINTLSNHKVDAIFNQPLELDSSKKELDTLLFKLRLKVKREASKGKLYQTDIFLTHLLENIRVATISIDLDGNILSFNRKSQKLWGYQQNFILGRHFDNLCVSENKCKCSPLFIKETMANGFYEGVLFFERADGTKFPGNLQTSIIKGEKDYEGIVIVIRDLTKQRELEHKLLDKNKLATLGMVVEGVAHEVRNPLITIGGFARRLLKKVGDDFPYLNYLKVIVEDVSRLETMVKDIESYVHFTKLHKPNFKNGKIEKIFEMAIDLVENNRWKGINLETEYDPTLPGFYLDVGYLVEMFFNLIENAIEAMPDGGNLTITTLRDNNTYCIVKISDTGRGIEKEKVDEIFDLFYTTKMSGVGLGLAKTHIIVDEHGGWIDVDSVKGEGTVVTVTLPLERRQKIRR